MGGKDPNRQPRLGSVRDTPPGWLRLVTCHACGHRGVLPAAALLRKHCELVLLEFALVGLRCPACRGWGATMTMVRLCDGSCPKLHGSERRVRTILGRTERDVVHDRGGRGMSAMAVSATSQLGRPGLRAVDGRIGL